MSLYKRPGSKYWWIKFTFDGELVQQSTKCKNKRDAETVEGAFRTQLALGKIGIEPKKKAPAFDDAANAFIEWSKIEHANQPGTYQRYYFSSENLKKYFKKTKVSRIESEDVENFIIWRSTHKSKKTGKIVTRSTVNYDLFVLKMIFKRLLDTKVLRDNPTRSVKQLPENERKFHVLTDKEEKRYLLACSQPLRDVAILMIESGMRCAEVYQLKRQDVFLNKGFLKVTKGKTRSSIRNVHLSRRAKEVLAYRMKKFKGENLFPQNDIDLAAPTRSLYESHLKTVKKLKYNFRLYDCRHTFASRAVEKGVDLLTLASMLGHSNLKMITRYAHPSERQKANAIRIMENVKAKAV